MIIKLHCQSCNKIIEVISSKPIGEKFTLQTYKCGHAHLIKNTEITINKNKPLLEALNGNKTFPFQDTGIQFIEKANFRALIADEMGLGKTIQSIGAVVLHKEELLPCIVICKSIAKYNWLSEFLNWLDCGHIPQIISNSNETWFDQFPIHITSYDMIRRLTNISKKPGAISKACNPQTQKIFDRAKLIIIDECHYIKNDTAARTIAIKNLCRNKKNIIALSGTPIKNNASEYFPILNILYPEIFSNKSSFLMTYCNSEWNGYTYKTTGLKNPTYFKEKTENFIIRREMDDVLPDLPAVRRNNNFVVLDASVEEIYDKEWKSFCEFYEENEQKKDFAFYNDILARMAKLRHITGLAKIDAAVEFIEEFLTQTNRKITLFIHHQKVAELLEMKLKEKINLLNKDLGMHVGEVLQLKASNIKDAESIINEFKKDNNRVLIASTLAAGESINLQFCSDCLLIERQWNPANEEQAAVGRFKRIGQTNSIGLTYLLAAGTIDDYFTDLVEQKRIIFQETMRGEESLSSWNEQSIIMELADVLIRKGREKFRL